MSCMDRVLWSVREGQVGEFDAPEIMAGYRSVNGQPRHGDFLDLPDGSGPWRVIDTMLADGTPGVGNVLIVELFGD
jgi:hypothetical protein